MIVTLQVEGQERPLRWSFDPRRVPMSAAEVIERRWSTDAPSYAAWMQAVEQGSARARRVLVWWLQHREHPSMRFEDVDPAVGDVEVEYTREELERAIAEVQQVKSLTPEERTAVLTSLERQLADLPEDDESGKAPSSSSSKTSG